MNIAELKDLYEKVREYDEIISIPNTVRYSELNSHQSTLSNIISSIDQFNADAKDQKDQIIQLKRIYQQCIAFIDELIEENLKMKYDHRLEIKKKEYVINKLKEFIGDKEDLDAEIPSDDDKKGKSDDKTKVLSKKEMEIIKSLKN